MKSPLRQIRDAAEYAELAARTCQVAKATQGSNDHLAVAAWQDVVSMLGHAAKPIAGPDTASRWELSSSAITLGTLTFCLTTGLVCVPHPERPPALAAITVASSLATAIVGQIVAVARNIRTARRQSAAVAAWDPTEAIADLRRRIAAIRVSLATRLSQPYLQAAQRIEWTEECLDRLERLDRRCQNTSPN